jgi:transcriptional regulator
MYIPATNQFTDEAGILEFMRRFSFATLITAKDNFPTATHLPFIVGREATHVTLTAHFAKANDHWKDIENHTVLIIFSEPHAYISPKHYDKLQNVPTWNYVSVHAYGKGEIISDTEEVRSVLERTIDTYDPSYKEQWHDLPEDYKRNMSKGIVVFKVVVTDIQAKKKLSQNKSDREQQTIVTALAKSDQTHEQLIAHYMEQLLAK